MKKIFVLASATFLCGQLMAQSAVAPATSKPLAPTVQIAEVVVTNEEQQKKADLEAKAAAVTPAQRVTLSEVSNELKKVRPAVEKPAVAPKKD